MTYRFQCALCAKHVQIDDWCMVRDSAAKHLKDCPVKEICIQSDSGGNTTFKKEKPKAA